MLLNIDVNMTLSGIYKIIYIYIYIYIFDRFKIFLALQLLKCMINF